MATLLTSLVCGEIIGALCEGLGAVLASLLGSLL